MITMFDNKSSLFHSQHHFSLPIECTIKNTNTDSSSTRPSLCQHEYFDTIAWLRGEIFIFKGKFVWRFSDKKQLVPGYPIHFDQIFLNIPKYVERIDAAYERKTDNAIILFYGNFFFDISLKKNQARHFLYCKMCDFVCR